MQLPDDRRQGRRRRDGSPSGGRKNNGRLKGIDLLANLCEVMDLFPVVSEEAIRELVGRMLSERLRREAAGKRRRPAPKKMRGRKGR